MTSVAVLGQAEFMNPVGKGSSDQTEGRNGKGNFVVFLRYKLLTNNLKIIIIWQQCMAKCGILVSQL